MPRYALIAVGVIVIKWRDLLLHAFDPAQARVAGLHVGLLHYGLLSLISLTIVGALQAVGIVLVLATQSPKVEVVPSRLRGNCAGRWAMRGGCTPTSRSASSTPCKPRCATTTPPNAVFVRQALP